MKNKKFEFNLMWMILISAFLTYLKMGGVINWPWALVWAPVWFPVLVWLIFLALPFILVGLSIIICIILYPFLRK